MKKNLAEISAELNRQSGHKDVPKVIFITDQQARPEPENIIENLPSGSMVILRDYDLEARADLGQALRHICKAKAIKFLVAADLALALSLEADGIHLPEHKIGEAEAIRADHPQFFITASCHSEAAIKRAQRQSVDAVLLAPVFPTHSHPETIENPKLTIGTESLKKICEKGSIPIYALGGINVKTAKELRHTGIAGIAAIRGL